jgi:hypothetical protein
VKERDHLKDLDVDGRIILKFILNKWNGKTWSEFIWFGMKTFGGSSEYVNEFSATIKFREFLDC